MRRSIFCWFFLGCLLFQAAWILADPPLRGNDEIDHVYRATSVAAGYLTPYAGETEVGNGFLVPVPLSVVRAATPNCHELHGASPRCDVGPAVGNDRVLMTSSAARYNPVFYALIGTVGRPFQGATADYAMRVAASILCALLFALAAMTLDWWARTRWPLASLAVAMVPEVLFSSSLPAPNGVEMAGGAVVWAALLGLLARPDLPARPLLRIAMSGAIPLVFVRSVGPLWAVLIVLTIVLLAGVTPCRRLLSRPRAATGAIAVGVVAALGIAWTLAAGTNALGARVPPTETVWRALPRLILYWPFQAAAAAPDMRPHVPLAVYAVLFGAICTLWVVAIARGGRRIAPTLVFVLVTTNGVAVAATISSWDYGGMLWQGRYDLPFTIGLVLIAGYGADIGRGPDRWAPAVVGLVAFGAHMPAAVSLLQHELNTSALSGSSEWFTAPPWAIGLLAGAGGILWIIAAASQPSTLTSAERNLRRPSPAGEPVP